MHADITGKLFESRANFMQPGNLYLHVHTFKAEVGNGMHDVANL